MPHQIQQTDLSTLSLELNFPQKYPLTSGFVNHPRKYHDLLAPNNMDLNHEGRPINPKTSKGKLYNYYSGK